MSSRISAAWGLTLAVLLSPLGARALEIPADIKSRLLGELGRGKTAGSPESELPDNSIDTARYLVGGGDAFQISIVGLPSMEYFPVVDASGNLYDGELGRIALGKIPLNRAQAVIAQTVRKSLRKNHDVYVAPKRVKSVSVNVTGYVFNPGTYTLTGNMRLMDAIRAANGGSTPSLAHTDFRMVDVRNGDSLHTYDLLRFISGNDIDANPYIYPGDNIILRPIDTKVFVTGEVLEPVKGAVPLKPGETVGNILDLVRLRGTADSGTITVFKAGADKNRPGPSPLPIAETRAIRLGPNDVIMVGAKQRRRRPDTVQVTGEVYRPGTYAFEPGQKRD